MNIQPIMVSATSEREAISQLVQKHSVAMRQNMALVRSNVMLRKQLEAAMNRIRQLETSED